MAGDFNIVNQNASAALSKAQGAETQIWRHSLVIKALLNNIELLRAEVQRLHANAPGDWDANWAQEEEVERFSGECRRER